MEYVNQDTNSRSHKKKGQNISELFFGINWKSHFPLALQENALVEISDFSSTYNFIKENYQHLFNEQENIKFLSNEFNDAKNRYYHLAGDCFLFKYNSNIVGFFIGTPIDWGSYYLRTAAILQPYRGKGFWKFFILHLIEILKIYNVERIEGDVSPSNFKQINFFNQCNFNINGIIVSERWGCNLHFTKYLSKKHHSVFLNQFCLGNEN